MVAFDTAEDKNAFMAVTAATSLAFFAMVGFEDSVNMAEETKDPVKIFPKMLLTGLTIAGIVYILVSIVAVALVPVGELEASDTPLVEVVKAGAPGLPIDKILPFITMFAVSNTALINMLMASRLIYGMARQHVLPPVLGRVHPRGRTPWVAIMFTTAIAFGLIIYVTAFANDKAISGARRDDVASAACGVRRRQRRGAGVAPRRAGGGRALQDADGVAGHRVSHLAVPGDAAVRTARRSSTCWRAFSFVIGIVLFFVTMAINRQLGVRGRRHQRPDASGRRAGLASHRYSRSRIVLNSSCASSSSSVRRVSRSWSSSVGGGTTRRRGVDDRSGGRLGVTM